MVRAGDEGLWRHRDFRRLWLARTVSQFGSLLGALPYTALFFLDASAAQMATLTVASVASGSLSGLVTGVWVDRLRRRPLMIAADASRAVALLSVFAAAMTDRLAFTHLYLAALLTGVLDVLFDVAAVAYLPSVVPQRRLVEANSRLVAGDAVVESTAFGVGGLIVQVASAPVAVLVDAGTFALSALGLSGVRAPEPAPTPSAERVGVLREATDGARFVVRDPTLRAIAASLVARDFAYGSIGAVILLFVARDLDFPPAAMGAIFAVGGVSSFVGALLTRRLTTALGTRRAMVLGMALTAVASAALPLARGPVAVAAVLLIAQQLLGDGFATVYEITSESVRQAIVPDRMLGRVDAAIRVAGLLATVAGALVAGALGGPAGLRVPLALGAAAQALGAVALLHRPPSSTGTRG